MQHGRSISCSGITTPSSDMGLRARGRGGKTLDQRSTASIEREREREKGKQ